MFRALFSKSVQIPTLHQHLYNSENGATGGHSFSAAAAYFI